MELRSLRFTISAGALALIACGSSAANSSPFENAANGKQDASTGNTSSSGGGSSSGSSSGGNDNQNMAMACQQDQDCNGGCKGATVCCCDPNALTCFSPASGECGSGGGGDSGASGDDGGGSSGDDAGDQMPMP